MFNNIVLIWIRILIGIDNYRARTIKWWRTGVITTTGTWSVRKTSACTGLPAITNNSIVFNIDGPIIT